jgi:hypothetical protein
VEVAAEDLYVARLVHGLRARVVLGIDPGHTRHELGGHDQSTLLTVKELGELQGYLGVTHAAPPALVELLEGSVAGERVHRPRDDLALGVDVGLPGELCGGVPLLALGLLVQVAQALLHAAVVPHVVGVEGGEDRLELGVALDLGGHGGIGHGVLLAGDRPYGAGTESRSD